MKIKLITVALSMAFITIASTSNSQTKTPRINHRQEHQQKRIAHGVKNGELTAKKQQSLKQEKQRFNTTKESLNQMEM